MIAEDGFRGLEDGNMFGRKLKKEYKIRSYSIVDSKTGEVAETRNMPIKDPVMEAMSVGFVFSVGVALVYSYIISPFIGKIVLSDNYAILLFGILFLIGVLIAYYFMSESD